MPDNVNCCVIAIKDPLYMRGLISHTNIGVITDITPYESPFNIFPIKNAEYSGTI